MNKPVPIIILSVLAMLNGIAAFALGILTILGSKFVFTPSGYGPDRIAISQLFGPLADQTGWILFIIGGLFILAGYGLFTFQALARLTVFWAFAILAGATLIAVGWGVFQGQWGVVIGGFLKIAVEITLCWYLTTVNVRNAFSS